MWYFVVLFVLSVVHYLHVSFIRLIISGKRELVFLLSITRN